MKSDPHREEALFQAAAQLSVAERASFLNGACHGDSALRQRLEALLAEREQRDILLAAAQEAARPTIKLDLADEPDEAVGQTIGRYQLLEKVGEGGCGVVYVAEQTEPVRRRVALKVIKLGMDTKAVVGRFEAERQALAMMDHSNIAKVLDGGTTGTGRPYFVMELVRGIKITEYCDQNQLNTKKRLDLFIKVCQAIQHAHQKGIIHRDIKPSNIMVTLHDGVPVPKVIDFGIAKATEGRLTDATVYTQLHQFIGTPAYMSPEQAEMSGLDIDTRSDIYSLGVLLYELLTGRTPFDANELVSQGIDAMRKTIREKEPVRPSTKVATLQGEELTTTAKRRSTDTAKLLHQLKGDLDWIVMKCLEKDRTRRYETANGLAFDLKRHLNDEPVLARPASAAYRFQKAFRRNKLAYTAGATVALGLSFALALTTFAFIRERSAFRAMMQWERRSAIERVRFAILSGDDHQTEQALDDAAKNGVSTAQLKFLRGQYLVTSGRPEQAVPELRASRELEPHNVATLGLLATACIAGATWADYEQLAPALRSAIPITPEDQLFLGQALVAQEPAKGITMMERGVQSENSPMACIALARAETMLALETGDMEVMRSAFTNITAAEAWARQSLPTLVVASFAHSSAARLYARAGKPELAKAEIAVANEVGQRLELFYPSPLALQTRAQQLILCNGLEEASERVRRWAGENPDPRLQNYYRTILLLQGDSRAAFRVVDSPGMADSARLLRFIAALDLPDSRTEALQLADALSSRRGTDLTALYLAVIANELMGRPKQAEEVAKDYQARMEDRLNALRPHYGRLVRFLAGELAEDTLLTASQGSNSAVCESSLFIGLAQLAKGDRQTARAHFQTALDTEAVDYQCYWLSWILRNQLDRKPAWPPTIPVGTQ